MKIVVVVDGGCVTDIMSDTPGVDVVLVDYDTDGVAEDLLVQIPQDDGTTAAASCWKGPADYEPAAVEQFFATAEEAPQ